MTNYNQSRLLVSTVSTCAGLVDVQVKPKKTTLWGGLAVSSLGDKRAEGRRSAFPGAARGPEGHSAATRVLPAGLPGKSIRRLEPSSHQNTQTKARLLASRRQCAQGGDETGSFGDSDSPS